jgi:hypothetical protein
MATTASAPWLSIVFGALDPFGASRDRIDSRFESTIRRSSPGPAEEVVALDAMSVAADHRKKFFQTNAERGFKL